MTFDPEREIRLPLERIRPEYGPGLRRLSQCESWDEFRELLREWVLQDRYILAVLCGYDTPTHRWDPIHLWMTRQRIPELRAIPGCQSAWFCPRGTYKTALEEVDITWSCLARPDLTYGIGSWKLDVAARILRQIKKNLELPVIYWLFPDVVWEHPRRAGDKWSDTELTVQRRTATKDATVTAFALEAPATSLHFDRLYLDDVVERRNTSTEYQLKKVVETMRDFRSLRSTPTSQVEIRGTMWDPDDWYNSVIMKDPEFIIERHPAYVEDPAEFEDAAPCPMPGLKPGDVLFPSPKPRDVLEADLNSMKLWHFGCQMLLRVESVQDAAFNKEDVLNYFSPDDLPANWQAVQVLDLATEDPESDDTDDSALGLFLAGPSGPGYNVYIYDGIAKREWAWPEIAALCFDTYEEWGGSLWIEEVGGFKAFERTLLLEAENRGYMIPHSILKREPGSGGPVKERIKELGSWYKQRRVLTRDPATVTGESKDFFTKYERQTLRWPRVKHDDVTEIVSDACRVALPPSDSPQPRPRRRPARVR